MRSSVDVVLLCGGKGLRTGSQKNKVLCYFGVKTAIEYCLDAFEPFCDNIVVVAAQKDQAAIKEIADRYGAKVVIGGDTRFSSVKNGLREVKSDIAIVHDAARPFVSADTIIQCIRSARKYGSGIAAVKVADTVKRVTQGVITEEINRDDLYYVQTPQAFVANVIKAAYDSAVENFNDDSAVYAAYGFEPHIVYGSTSNKKITFPEDLLSTPPCDKIGLGIDFHKFAYGRKLIIGGVHIPYEVGLLGNSDADVLVHSIMDALLSAAGLPDIGVLFPCTDEFKDADSMELLKIVVGKVNERNYHIASVSGVIMAEKPKMKDYIPLMRDKLASVLGTDVDHINISATTTEGLGIIGEKKGVAASAICLLQERKTL